MKIGNSEGAASAFVVRRRGRVADMGGKFFGSLPYGFADDLETVGGNARRGAGDADGCHRALRRIKDRCGDAADAVLDFLVVNCKAAVADALQFTLERKHAG